MTVNARLLSAFHRHQAPVTGFVIQSRAETLGVQGSQILKRWMAGGFELGNHSYSHSDFNTLSVEQIEEEILRGEGGRHPKWFRFPSNATGNPPERHAAIAAFLAG